MASRPYNLSPVIAFKRPGIHRWVPTRLKFFSCILLGLLWYPTCSPLCAHLGPWRRAGAGGSAGTAACVTFCSPQSAEMGQIRGKWQIFEVLVCVE